MDAYCVLSLSNYWRDDDSLPDFKLRRVMPQYRFEQIKRFLHVSNHLKDQFDAFVFNKLDPLMTHIKQVCREL